ncbi:MAG: HEAT repeat domain-containing protein [Alphaproteobacteria bacterium]
MQIARKIPTPPGNKTTSVAGSQPQPTVSLDGDREDRLRAVRRLIRQPDVANVNDLVLLLSQDDDPIIRRTAAIGLGKLRTPEAREALIAALSDEDSLVRRRAIRGLGKTWRNQAVEPLSAVLIEDPEPNVRRQAALRLGRIFSEEAYRSLDAARFDTDFSVRRAVMAGLARLQDM